MDGQNLAKNGVCGQLEMANLTLSAASDVIMMAEFKLRFQQLRRFHLEGILCHG